jgi:hypothetical protein
VVVSGFCCFSWSLSSALFGNIIGNYGTNISYLLKKPMRNNTHHEEDIQIDFARKKSLQMFPAAQNQWHHDRREMKFWMVGFVQVYGVLGNQRREDEESMFMHDSSRFLSLSIIHVVYYYLDCLFDCSCSCSCNLEYRLFCYETEWFVIYGCVVASVYNIYYYI